MIYFIGYDCTFKKYIFVKPGSRVKLKLNKVIFDGMTTNINLNFNDFIS